MNQRKALFAAARAGVLVLVVMASTLIAASSASALPTEAAWWQLDSRTAPKFLPPGGNGVIEASATNLGDAGVAGTAGTPLKLTDAVPAGLEVTKLKVTAGTEENPLLLSLLNCALKPIGGGARECGSKTAKQGKCVVRPASSGGGSTVECILEEGTLEPYEIFEVRIFVNTLTDPSPSGSKNEVRVAGGEAVGGPQNETKLGPPNEAPPVHLDDRSGL